MTLCYVYVLYHLYLFALTAWKLEFDFGKQHRLFTEPWKRNVMIKLTRKPNGNSKYPISINQPYKINNEDICSSHGNISTIVIIYTRPKETSFRKKLRQYLRNSTYFAPEDIRHVFLLGLTIEPKIQIEIENENDLYKDIVQGYFLDRYTNLTNKGVMGFKWITEYCMNTNFVTKLDGDMFVDFKKAFDKFQFFRSKKKSILCAVKEKGTSPILRDPKDPWYVNPNELKGLKLYPKTYCSGCVVFMTTDLIPLLYRAAFKAPFFWVDDYYLFGDLPSSVQNVTFISLRPWMALTWTEFSKCYQSKRQSCDFVAVHTNRYSKYYFLWDKWQQRRFEHGYRRINVH